MKEYNDLNVYLAESSEKFQNLTASFDFSKWNGSLREDFISQFNLFKHNFQSVSHFKQQIERLYLFVDQLPNFEMRNVNLKPPKYDKSRILVKYSQPDVIFCLFFFIRNKMNHLNIFLLLKNSTQFLKMKCAR